MSSKTGNGDHSKSREEEDLQERNTKKVKGGNHEFTNDASMPISYADVMEDMNDGDPVRRSYKETMLGVNAGSSTTQEATSDGGKSGEDCLGGMNLQIIEKQHGGHDCPEIVVPPTAEERLCRPWRQGLLVKLLGRRIGFKALENRLNQMWVQKGTMNIMDLGSEFYLVYLSSPDDHNHALSNGPWLIYDHYLTVREWRPNFRPEKEEINRVAVWVRLPELPVEYYNSDFLWFLGDRIGRTVKVDKTTQLMARGKYARLCVEIDLDAPLLAMFEIKNHIYKIEYEGLHLLCMVCGKFGHHKDQCVDKKIPEPTNGEIPGEPVDKGTSNGPSAVKADGPWTVVQKQRWPRKVKDKSGPVGGGGGRVLPATITGNSGSRFGVLSVHGEPSEIHGITSQNVENVVTGLLGEKIVAPTITNNGVVPKNKARKTPTKSHVMNPSTDMIVESTGVPRENNQHAVSNVGETVRKERVTVATASKGTPPTRHTHASETRVHSLEGNAATHVLAHVQHATFGLHPLPATVETNTKMQDSGSGLGHFHTSRPPDPHDMPASHTPSFTDNTGAVGFMEVEEFVDASEQGDGTGSETEMEMVVETPTSRF